jgi:hypothetical protein
MGGRGGSSGVSINRPAQIGDEVYVADWFKFDLPEYAMQPRRVRILEESASRKAWKVDIDTETKDGERGLYYTKFIPKAAVKTKGQVEFEQKQAQKNFESGAKRYNKMIEFAKAHGVKGVRVGLRKETILEKIKKAGLKYKY